MSPESQRIAIAEACGWKWLNHPETIDRTKTFTLQGRWVLSPRDELEFPHNAPDYLNDLNAMHKVEKLLSEHDDTKSREEYRLTLMAICQQGWSVFASAAQRAEAFLRTIGKWVEL